MNIAIQGHPTRGKEVIQILESLGGKNDCPLKGTDKDSYYYIYNDSRKGIRCHYCDYVNKCKKYTLEEFEKEFPFKVGDTVIDYEEDVATITGFAYIEENLGYSLQYENGTGKVTPRLLKFYKEMKEERNITLTLDKAKEWYKKGGELKEIALQAFTEKELTKVDLPKTWEEFCENYPVKIGECWIGSQDIIYSATITQDRMCKNWMTSRRSANAHLAMIQLEQLRDCWRQGWIPTPEKAAYAIKIYGGKLGVFYYCTKEFLSFPTREIAKEFLECFRDLIEKAGDLI